MPYVLRFDGVNDQVQVPDQTLATNCDVEIKVTWGTNSTANYRHIFGNYVGASPGRWFMGQRTGTTTLEFFYGTHYNTAQTLVADTDYVIRAEKRGSNWTFFVNESNVGDVFSSGRDPLAEISLPAFPAAMDVHYFKYTDIDNSANNRYWDPSSTPSGSTLPETLGSPADNGTLVNFPTDDSQWVLVGGGPGTDNLLADDISQTVTLSQPALGVAHNLLADDIDQTVTLSQPALGVVHNLLADDISQTVTLSQPALDRQHTMPPAVRVYQVPAEDRMVALAAENRTHAVVAETRTFRA